MAKGNLFIGQARGKVGDVVFYRAYGAQVSRSRNRSPRNPKTDAQIYQRAIAATIAQAYKAGKAIFDHSFEGKSVPSGSQRRFISLNMRKLRQSLESWQMGGVSANDTRLVSPSAMFPVPNSYIVSEGSLDQNFFVINNTESLSFNLPNGGTEEKLSEYCTRFGLVAGEIYTVVAFGLPDSYDVDDLISPHSIFSFIRFIVKSSALTSETLVSEANLGDLFKVDSTSTGFDATSFGISETIMLDDFSGGDCRNGSMGVIRSNENLGLRSNCVMSVYNADYGVQWPNVLDAWKTENKVQSELILEGGDF